MILRKTIAGAAILLGLNGTAAMAATNLTGNYTVTVEGHPGFIDGEMLCAALVEDGSTLGYTNSGTFTLMNIKNGAMVSGRWFTRNFAVTFEASSGNDFYAFSGVLGHAQIQGTSFVEVYNGTPVAGGTFTATKGCPAPVPSVK